jgi:hypothetical protein
MDFKLEEHEKLIEMCRHINRLIDICNGRAADGVKGEFTLLFTPENGLEVQEELLDILAWFADWEDDHKQRVAGGTATEYNFLPKQTWRNLKRLILGLVVIIQHYCIEKKFTIVPRKLNTDPCEHLFGRARESGGSTGAINSTQADLHDANDEASRGAARVAGNNNYWAPPTANRF